MGIALLKIKIMPSSPSVNLEEIKQKAKEIVEKNKGTNCTFQEEPIAFGLNAIMVYFHIDESDEVDPIEEEFKKIENVASVQIIDMRRAFG